MTRVVPCSAHHASAGSQGETADLMSLDIVNAITSTCQVLCEMFLKLVLLVLMQHAGTNIAIAVLMASC